MQAHMMELTREGVYDGPQYIHILTTMTVTVILVVVVVAATVYYIINKLDINSVTKSHAKCKMQMRH